MKFKTVHNSSALLLVLASLTFCPVYSQSGSADTIPAGSPQKESTVSEIDDLIDSNVTKVAPLASVIDKLQLKITGHQRKINKLTGIEVTATNATDRPLVIEGAESVLNAGSAHLKCASEQIWRATISEPENLTRQKFIKGVEGGVVGLATVGAVKAISDQVIETKPVRLRYGSDEVRREQEQTRFGKRVLFPGDTFSGYVYFSGPIVPAAGSSIEMSVRDFNNAKDSVQATAR